MIALVIIFFVLSLFFAILWFVCSLGENGGTADTVAPIMAILLVICSLGLIITFLCSLVI